MGYVHWNPESARLAKFSASVASGRGAKQIIRIELETSDPYELGAIIQRLREIETDEMAKGRAAARSQRAEP